MLPGLRIGGFPGGDVDVELPAHHPGPAGAGLLSLEVPEVLGRRLCKGCRAIPNRATVGGSY
jgi:hypothetical protein